MDLKQQRIAIVGVSSNDPEQFPEDDPKNIKEQATTIFTTFPYLYDDTQEVAKNYRADCTTEFFLFDKSLCLYYHDQLDDTRPNNDIPVIEKDLRQAIERMNQGKLPRYPQVPCVRCSIKVRCTKFSKEKK